MPRLTELAAKDCPLLRADADRIITAFNQAAKLVDDVARGEVSAILDRDENRRLLQKLESVRATLTRPRYNVGFLGTSSAGKSTIFNRVLQQEIAKSGSGDATTSLPSRLRRSTHREHACRLVFLNHTQYEDRRKKLCQEMGIGTPPTSNLELLNLLQQPQALRSEEGQARPLLEHDIAYLRAFLGSYDRHGKARVRTEAVSIEVPYEERAQFINHTSGSEAYSENLLLRQAELVIANERIPPELEMCDLPGLNSKRSVDTIITTDFLDELDGALLFVNVAENLFNANVSEILVRLKQRFGEDLTGRAWVVFNKCDSLTENHYRPSTGSPSIFDNIQKFLKDNSIPVSQVCFSSSRIHQLIDPTTGKADPGRAAAALFLPPDEPIPPTCPPEMKAHFEELLKDGGIGRLAHLIRTTIANSVASKISQSVEGVIHEFSTELQHRMDVEKRRLRGGRQLRKQALSCRNTVLQLREGLGGRPEEFSLLAELAEHLRGKLHECIRQSPQYVDVVRSMPPEKLHQEFKLHVSMLNDTLEGELRDEVIDKLYSEIAQRLDALPIVPVAQYPGGCQAAWQAFRIEDRNRDDWRSHLLPRFDSNELMNSWGDGRQQRVFDGDTYLALMDEKVATSVRQTVHALRTRLRTRLRQLEEELHLLIVERDEESESR